LLIACYLLRLDERFWERCQNIFQAMMAQLPGKKLAHGPLHLCKNCSLGLSRSQDYKPTSKYAALYLSKNLTKYPLVSSAWDLKCLERNAMR